MPEATVESSSGSRHQTTARAARLVSAGVIPSARMAARIVSEPTTAGSHWMRRVRSSRFTCQDATPGRVRSRPSIARTSSWQSISATRTTTTSEAAPGISARYPVRPTASATRSRSVISASYSTWRLAAAKFAAARRTPGTWVTPCSTAPAHSGQSRPSSRRVAWRNRSVTARPASFTHDSSAGRDRIAGSYVSVSRRPGGSNSTAAIPWTLPSRFRNRSAHAGQSFASGKRTGTSSVWFGMSLLGDNQDHLARIIHESFVNIPS